MPKKRYRSKPNREAAVAPRHAGPAREADEATPTDKVTQQLAQEREKVRHLEAEVQDLRVAAGSAGAPPVPSLGPVHAPTTWWRTLRLTLATAPFLRGRQALVLPTLVTAFEADGITGVQQTLDQHGSAAAARARHLLALAKHYQKLNQPGRSAILGRAAYDINPQPTVAKWLAFRLFDAGHIHEPLTLLQGPASTCVFSASEGKRVEEIRTLAKLAQELPAVPAKAGLSYKPTDGALLYVAASCLPCHNSGYTNRTHELNLALKAAGGKVTIVTRPGYPWDRPDRTSLPNRLSTHNEGLDYLHIRTPTLAAPLDEYFAQAANSIARVAKKDRVAAIHAASNYINAVPALIAARQLGLPFAYEMRGLWDMTRAAKIEEYEDSDRYRLGMQLEAMVAKEADRVFVISEALGQYIKKEWDVDPAKIALLPNCVNLETMERAKKMAGPKPDVFTVGYAGSLVEYEGLDLLIDALAELQKAGTVVHARIIGDGPEREKLQERAESSGLNGQVQFLGRLAPDEARTRLAETHAAILPRRKRRVCELIPPLKSTEADALLLPVIVPRMPALLEQRLGSNSVRHEFEPQNKNDLARLLQTLSKQETPSAQDVNATPDEALFWKHYIEKTLQSPTHGQTTKERTHDPGAKDTVLTKHESPAAKNARHTAKSNKGPEPKEIEPDLEVIETFFEAFATNTESITSLLNPLTPPLEREDVSKSFFEDLAAIYEDLAKETRSQKLARAVLRLHLRLGDLHSAIRVHREHNLNSREVQRLMSLERHLKGVSATIAPPAMPMRLARRPIVYLLHNCLPYHSGGYAARAHGLITGWRKAGFEIVPIARLGYPYDRKPGLGSISSMQEVDGVTYRFLPETKVSVDDADQPAYWEEYAEAVISLLQKEDIEPAMVIAASFFGNALAGRKVADRFGVPLAYDMRGMAWLTNRSNNFALKGSTLESVLLGIEVHAAHTANHVFCITRQLREWLTTQGLDRSKLLLLPNGTDPSQKERTAHAANVRQLLHIPPSAFVIGYVGTVVYYEGLDTLVDAVATLRREGLRDLHLLIVGDGKHFENLRRRVEASPELAQCINFAGRVSPSELDEYFDAIDCVVIPRLRSELSDMISPMKPFDALLRRKPLVVSNCAALTEIAEAASGVAVFEAGNSSHLAQRIRAEYEARGSSRAHLDEGRRWVETKRSWEFIARESLRSFQTKPTT